MRSPDAGRGSPGLLSAKEHGVDFQRYLLVGVVALLAVVGSGVRVVEHGRVRAGGALYDAVALGQLAACDDDALAGHGSLLPVAAWAGAALDGNALVQRVPLDLRDSLGNRHRPVSHLLDEVWRDVWVTKRVENAPVGHPHVLGFDLAHHRLHLGVCGRANPDFTNSSIALIVEKVNTHAEYAFTESV